MLEKAANYESGPKNREEQKTDKNTGTAAPFNTGHRCVIEGWDGMGWKATTTNPS